MRRLVSHHHALTTPSSAVPSSSSLQERLLTAGPLQPTGTGGVELTFLGSSSQGGARRYPSSMAMRLRGMASSEVWLFDAGEGALAQLQRSSMKIGLVRNIFITHLHGDHLYGLPGLVLSVLRSRLGDPVADLSAASSRNEKTPPLDVYGPQGIRSFLRMSLGVAGFYMPERNILRIHELMWPKDFGPRGKRNRGKLASTYWATRVKRLQYEALGRDIEPVIAGDQMPQYTYDLIKGADSDLLEDMDGNVRSRKWAMEEGPASVVAAPVLHTVPTFAFSMTENVVSRRFDKTKLRQFGIPADGKTVRPLFNNWTNGKSAEWGGVEISPEDVMHDGRAPRRVCVIGDTYDANGASHIAQGVDVLVHEATNVAAQTAIAKARGHSSTLGSTGFAKKVEAKRLILNHTSVGYSERKIREMETEARGMFGANKAFVARDLSVFSVPTKEEDSDEFLFRRFVGFVNSLEYSRHHDSGDNPFQQDVVVDNGENYEASPRVRDDREKFVDENGEGEVDGDMNIDDEIDSEMDDDATLNSLGSGDSDAVGHRKSRREGDSASEGVRRGESVFIEELKEMGVEVPGRKVGYGRFQRVVV